MSSSSRSSSPPIPSLPFASELRKYTSSPADFISPITHYTANEKAQNLVYYAWEATTVKQKFQLCQKALKIFPFSVDAFNCMANLFSELFPNEGDVALEKAEQTYKLAMKASYILWPDLKEQELVEWGHVEHRPFLRSMHGFGVVLNKRGKTKESSENFRYLLRVNPNDNQGVKTLLFYNMIEIGEYAQAEKVCDMHSNGRDTTDSYFLYGYVLIDYLKYKLGCCSQLDLDESLLKAIQNNNHVVPLLLSAELPERPEYVSSGSSDEAKSIVVSIKKILERTLGFMDWLNGTRYRSGKKPNDDGSILFSLLEKGTILVEMNNGTELELTSYVDIMPGKGLAEFCLAPGMKEHDPEKIVAFQFDEDPDIDFLSNFTSFHYDEVCSIPFWNVLHNSPIFEKDDKEHHCDSCFEIATLKCSVCQVAWYCSQSCQQKEWIGEKNTFCPGHIVMCKKFIKH